MEPACEETLKRYFHTSEAQDIENTVGPRGIQGIFEVAGEMKDSFFLSSVHSEYENGAGMFQEFNWQAKTAEFAAS